MRHEVSEKRIVVEPDEVWGKVAVLRSMLWEEKYGSFKTDAVTQVEKPQPEKEEPESEAVQTLDEQDEARMAELFDEIFVAKDFKYFIKQPEAAEPILQQSEPKEPSQKEANSVKSVELPSFETSRADPEEQESADFNFKEVRLPNAICSRVTSQKQSKELDAVFDPSDHS